MAGELDTLRSDRTAGDERSPNGIPRELPPGSEGDVLSARPVPARPASGESESGLADPAAVTMASDKVHSAPPVNGLSVGTPGMPGIPVDDPAADDSEIELPSGIEDDSFPQSAALPASAGPGAICRGQIVGIDAEGVIIDIGAKTEGIAPLDDFRDEAGELRASVGDEVDVLFEEVGAAGEYASLSRRKALQSRLWERLESARETREILSCKVTGRVKGGLSVDIGVPAFLPGSHIGLRPVSDLDSWVGREPSVRILKINRKRGNVVVSRRDILEEERNKLREVTLAKLEESGVITGVVKNVNSYGVFVDLSGMDGLIHVTDLSWGRVRSPEDVVSKGDEITAKVLRFDRQKHRVSLSLKHLSPDPWKNIEERCQAGDHATGKVVSLSDFGVFVELDSGIEGLVHVSELSWSRRKRSPAKMFKIGDAIEVKLLRLDTKERRVSLSVKQLHPDPWSTIGERYGVGSVVRGTVRSLTTYGAFVEIEEGIEGLVHVSDLSWDRTVNNPKNVLKKGQRIQAAVLRADPENRRLALGIKQLEPDVWESYFSEHMVGETISGIVKRRAKFGFFVELAPGIEALCHNSELPKTSAKKTGANKKGAGLTLGQEYPFRIISADEFEKKIALTRRHVADPPSPRHKAGPSAPGSELPAGGGEPLLLRDAAAT